MEKRLLAILNTDGSIQEFESGFYICPNTKTYTFTKMPVYLGSYYKSEIKYIAERRAYGILKKINGKYYISNKIYSKIDEDIIDDLLIKTYELAQNMGIYDREADLLSEGNQIFLLKKIREINASYKHSSFTFSKLYSDVTSSDPLTIDLIYSKLLNKNLNEIDLKNINLDLLKETKIPDHFKIGTPVTPDPIIDNKKILFCNVSWMEKYEGLEGVKMSTGGSYVKTNGFGLEMYNFYVEPDGYCRGYVKNTSVNKENDYESTINLNKIDPSANGNYIDGITVVFVANNDKDKYGSRIVGFYEDARVYSHLHKRHENSITDMPFIIETKKENAICIPIEYRKMQIPRGKKGYLGQSNVWYADSMEEDVVNFVRKVKGYLYNVKKGNDLEVLLPSVLTWTIPCNPTKYDIEAAFRKYEEIEWTQSQQLNNIKINDIVYIYVGAPISRIRYKCIVTEVNIETQSIDDSEFILENSFFDSNRRLFKMRLLKKVDNPKLSINELNKNGVAGNIQGARELVSQALSYIDDNVNLSDEQIIASDDEIDLINKFNEEETESLLNVSDESSGYIFKNVLTKYRVVNQRILNDLKKIYNDRCQICGEKIGEEFGDGIVEAHHIEYFSQTQNNDASNILIVCPNHHALIHKHNAVYDKEKICYKFSNGKELFIKIPGHLKKL